MKPAVNICRISSSEKCYVTNTSLVNSVAEGEFNFVYIHVLRTRFITVPTVPAALKIRAFKNQFSPTIENAHPELFNIIGENVEDVIVRIVWVVVPVVVGCGRKSIWNDNIVIRINAHGLFNSAYTFVFVFYN